MRNVNPIFESGCILHASGGAFFKNEAVKLDIQIYWNQIHSTMEKHLNVNFMTLLLLLWRPVYENGPCTGIEMCFISILFYVSK